VATTRRYSAIVELKARLQDISVSNGYETDAGAHVLVGEEPTFGPDDPTSAIAVSIGTDEPGYQGEHIAVTLPVEVGALVKADVDQPWLTVEQIVGDIKTAVETDHDLAGILLARGLERGSVKPLERQEGSEYVGAVVEYRLRLKELWGAP
jgi:hypothetical protein